MKLLSALDYRELAFEVLRVFFTDYSDDELKDCVKKAYDKKLYFYDIADYFYNLM